MPGTRKFVYKIIQNRLRVVMVEEITAENWTLNIACYVLPPIDEDNPPLDETTADFKAALDRVREAEVRSLRVMDEGGWVDA